MKSAIFVDSLAMLTGAPMNTILSISRPRRAAMAAVGEPKECAMIPCIGPITPATCSTAPTHSRRFVRVPSERPCAGASKATTPNPASSNGLTNS